MANVIKRLEERTDAFKRECNFSVSPDKNTITFNKQDIKFLHQDSAWQFILDQVMYSLNGVYKGAWKFRKSNGLKRIAQINYTPEINIFEWNVYKETERWQVSENRDTITVAFMYKGEVMFASESMEL